MRRLDASREKNAGIDPTSTSAGIPAAHLSLAAALAGGRRLILCDAFWLGSASGAMLRSHEAPAPHRSGNVVCRVDDAGDDLRARRERRHQDLFGSPAAGRSTRRPATGADLFRAAPAE